MHLSRQTFISASPPLYFFVDTNSQQCFKNIHTKRGKEITTTFYPSSACPGHSRRHIALFAFLTGFPLTCPATLASANPFICSFICAPSSANAKPLSEQLQESWQRWAEIIIDFTNSIAFPGGETHFYTLFCMVKYQILSLWDTGLLKRVRFFHSHYKIN